MINACRKRREAGDEGAVLILAILMIGAVGLAIGAIATQMTSQFLVTETVNTRADKMYAADAGVNAAIDVLQREMSSSRTHCLDPTAGQQDLTTSGALTALNGHSVTYTCQTLQGDTGTSSGINPIDFALITTGSSMTSGSLTSQSGSSSYNIHGSIYVAGGVDVRSNSGGDLDNPLIITRGDVGQYTSNCTGHAGQWATTGKVVTTAPAQSAPVCVPYTPSQVAPSYVLPTDGSAFLTPDAEWTTGSCHVYFPGRYTSAPSDNNSYFASGLYYFDGVGQVGIGPSHTFVAGQANTTASGLDPSPPTPCLGTATTADTLAIAHLTATSGHVSRVSGNGATFVLGGSSNFLVHGGLYVNARNPYSGEPVSFYGVRTSDELLDSNWHHWTTTSSTLAIANSGGSADLRADGAINTYDAGVSLFGSGGASLAARAGVTAKFINIKAASAAPVFSAFDSTSGSPLPRTLLITSTATGTGSDSTTVTDRAIITISNTAPYHVSILSWHTEIG